MKTLFDILVCTRCGAGLHHEIERLECERCASVYPIEGGIPDMRADLDEVKRMQAQWFDTAVDEEYEIERPHGTPAFHAWLLEEKFRCAVRALGRPLEDFVVACVCAGSGMDAEFLARDGAKVLAFDVSPGAARRAAERARRRGLAIFPVIADAEHLPLSDRSVDMAFVHDGLHHLERPRIALAEMARVAEWAVSVTEPARAAATRLSIAVGYSGNVEEAGNKVERLTPHEVGQGLVGAGFRVIQSRRYAMVYRHKSGVPARVLSRPGLFVAARVGFRLANLVLGPIGNKLAVQAVRDDQSRRRIVVHDFGGFPFPVQLSRELAERGNAVLHLHCPSYPNGRGRLTAAPDDPKSFASEPVDIGSSFRKYAPLGRFVDELSYGRQLRRRIRRFEPDVVISDAPLLVQHAAQAAARRTRAAFLFWQQDVHGLAMRHISGTQHPLVGRLAGRLFPRFERKLLLRSDAVVAVGESFLDVLDEWGIPGDRVSVIENWAPIEELPLVERDNSWRGENGLDGVPFYLYAGTLGVKHDCNLLFDLARDLGARGAKLVVASEGLGADALTIRVGREPNEGLIIVPFQPFERLGEMLGAADVVVALLSREFAGVSVPSKVLTYHCAGRPLLAAMPIENPASQFILRAGSGIVVEPEDRAGFLEGAIRLLEDNELRAELGLRARSYAESVFSIDAVADRFGAAIRGALIVRMRG